MRTTTSVFHSKRRTGWKKLFESYRKALSIKPDYAEAHNNLGATLDEMGQLDEAIASYIKALSIKPDYADAIMNLSIMMKGRKWNSHDMRYSSDLKGVLISCFGRDDIEHQDLFHAVLSILFENQVVNAIKDYLSEVFTEKQRELFIDNKIILGLIQDNLFQLLLKKTVIADPLAELFLTKVRKSIILLTVSKMLGNEELKKFESFIFAVAKQCFWNEYVYFQTHEEKQAVKIIILITNEIIVSDRRNAQVYAALLSCYAPLSSYEFISKVSKNRDPHDSKDFQELIDIQIEQPLKEKEIASRIKILSPIKDEVSKKVKQQYEENPYPRWMGIYRNTPVPFTKYLCTEVYPNKLQGIQAIEKSEVLVAGCGTGRHPISCAQGYKDSFVLAIDLSLPSLSYAKRKADELGGRKC